MSALKKSQIAKISTAAFTIFSWLFVAWATGFIAILAVPFDDVNLADYFVYGLMILFPIIIASFYGFHRLGNCPHCAAHLVSAASKTTKSVRARLRAQYFPVRELTSDHFRCPACNCKLE